MRRAYHAGDPEAPADERDATLIPLSTSTGSGGSSSPASKLTTQATATRFRRQVLPTDSSAGAPIVPNPPDAGPGVVVNGQRVYDNKGRVIAEFEPYFAAGWDFAPPEEAERGHLVVMFYDPRGRLVRSVQPDGSQQRIVFGVPHEPADPDRFDGTSWEMYTYDPNDNAGRTHPDTAREYEHHWDTPTSVEFDALGRSVRTTERDRAPREAGDPLPPVTELVTHSSYDIRGNLLAVTDVLGRTDFSYVHDLADRLLRAESPDAGLRRRVLDAAGNDIERRDGRGALVVQAHDALDRPVRRWARDDAGSPTTLRELFEYGDGSSRANHRPSAPLRAARTASAACTNSSTRQACSSATATTATGTSSSRRGTSSPMSR